MPDSALLTEQQPATLPAIATNCSSEIPGTRPADRDADGSDALAEIEMDFRRCSSHSAGMTALGQYVRQRYGHTSRNPGPPTAPWDSCELGSRRSYRGHDVKRTESGGIEDDLTRHLLRRILSTG
jgi:hypothetical protein